MLSCWETKKAFDDQLENICKKGRKIDDIKETVESAISK
jgi:hypothetical protein